MMLPLDKERCGPVGELLVAAAHWSAVDKHIEEAGEVEAAVVVLEAASLGRPLGALGDPGGLRVAP